LDDLGVNEKIKIKMILQDVGWKDGLDFCGSKYAEMLGSCECGNEALVFRKVQGYF